MNQQTEFNAKQVRAICDTCANIGAIAHGPYLYQLELARRVHATGKTAEELTISELQALADACAAMFLDLTEGHGQAD